MKATFLKYRRAILFLLPLFLVGCYFFMIYRAPLYIIQPDLQGSILHMSLRGYTDSIHGGKTTIKIEENTPNKLRYSYELKDGYKYKFAYANYDVVDTAWLDLSVYNQIKVNIKAKYGSRIQFVMNYLNPATDANKETGRGISQYILNVSGKPKTIEVSFDDLYTPDWWFTENNITEQEFKGPDLSKVTQIAFSNCINLNNNIPDTVEVRELSFHVNLLGFFIQSGSFLAFYYLVLGFFIYREKVKRRQPEINFQDGMDTNNYLNKEEALLFDYLTTHYFQQELSITDVQSATGIAERRISALIKEKTSLNFKQFLNKLRTVEAKRLLSQTDLQVSEIAFKVGYSNVSHFNRVFKTFENCSPNDYRKEYLKGTL